MKIENNLIDNGSGSQENGNDKQIESTKEEMLTMSNGDNQMFSNVHFLFFIHALRINVFKTKEINLINARERLKMLRNSSNV